MKFLRYILSELDEMIKETFAQRNPKEENGI